MAAWSPCCRSRRTGRQWQPALVPRQCRWDHGVRVCCVCGLHARHTRPAAARQRGLQDATAVRHPRAHCPGELWFLQPPGTHRVRLGLFHPVRHAVDGHDGWPREVHLRATGPGHRCYNGGGSDCYPYSNMVVLKHPDGTTSQYKHMNRVDVNVGQTVRRGQVLGLSGSTGYSTGPHAHVMCMTDCGLPNCQSVRTVFVDQPGDGIPNQGATVQSGNCR
ncbi:MAG: M23 family metallopeptidase [Flavobacteriales bacterium]|nr:M23 family metallopeptidase [Flavobacteriales bacterium]